MKSIFSSRGVFTTLGVGVKGISSIRGVEIPIDVGVKGITTSRGVRGPRGVVVKGLKSIRGVDRPLGVGVKGPITNSRCCIPPRWCWCKGQNLQSRCWPSMLLPPRPTVMSFIRASVVVLTAVPSLERLEVFIQSVPL